MMGKNGLQFTGQQSDTAGGAAYNAPAGQQLPFGGAPIAQPNPRPNPRPHQGPGGMPNQGVPGAGGGGGHGGGGRPNPRGNNSQGGKPNQGGGGQQGQGQYLGFPETPPAPPNFLPMTPQYEAAQRASDDALMQQLQGIQNQQNLVSPVTNLQASRLGTDMGYANQALLEDLAGRGVAQGGIYPQLYERDIGIPYGRQFQDLALGAGQQYGNLMGQTGEAYGQYDSALIEALLNRAAQVAGDMPLSLPSTYPPKGPQHPGRPRRNRRRHGGSKK
jgi:hypothetical protein